MNLFNSNLVLKNLQKFSAMGFNTVSIDGYDCNQIRQALSDAQNSDNY